MGRAARRQQERAARRQARQEQRGAPAGPSLSTSAPAAHAGPTRTGGSFLKPRWASDIISELKKVTWPTRQETAHLTLVVIVVSALIGVVLGAADLGFNWFVENTILR